MVQDRVNQPDVKIIPVILAGGAGTRLWPASRAGMAKQYLSPLGGPSLIQATWERIRPLAQADQVFVVTVEGHEELVAAQLPGVAAEHIWAEPRGRNTGPSIAWALHELRGRQGGGVAVFFPADHMVSDGEAFRSAVRQAAAAAQQKGSIGLLGVVPAGPETGFGYVEAGPAGEDGTRPVARFLEKPDVPTARKLVRRDDVFWNSGVFAIPLDTGGEIVSQAAPDLGAFMDRLPGPGTSCRRGDAQRRALGDAFGGVPACPFDVAVMERTDRRLLVPLQAGWSDLGTWQAVWEQGEADPAGNVLGPGARAVDSTGCLVTGDGRGVSVLGARDLIVVAWGDEVLVCPRERAQDVRQLARSGE